MAFHKLTGISVGADLSTFRGFQDIPLYVLNSIIGLP